MTDCDSKTSFNSVSNIGETLFTSELEVGMKMFFDWAFLGVGGWSDVTIPTSGAFGGNFNTLRAVSDPAYTDGQVWETARKDWVWESGASYSGESAVYNPIAISGVYINDTLYTTGDGTYAHHYNYPLGRVVFDNAISTTSSVEIEHSYRNVQVYVADQAPWWDELQYNSLRVDDTTFDNIGSGNWGILSNHRVQMPALVIEALPKRSYVPYQLGSTSQFVYQDVAFHIVAESRWWRNQLIDIISKQKDSSIFTVETDTLISSGAYPLDYRGMLVDASNNYANIVSTGVYKSQLCRFSDIKVAEMFSYTQNLHQATVRVTFETLIT